MGYMEKVREHYRDKKIYGKNLKSDELIRRILGRPGLQSSASQDIPIHADLDLNKLIENRDGMNTSWSVVADRPITSHRKIIGKFIVFGKKVVRKLLRWYINPIAEEVTRFNSYATSAINEMTNKMLLMERNFKVIDRKLRLLEEQLEQGGKQLDSLSDLRNELHQQRADLTYTAYRLRQLEAKKAGLSSDVEVVCADNSIPFKDNQKNTGTDKGIINYEHQEPDYFLFENRFRGSEEKIKEALRYYLPWFKEGQNVLDIGCGRGEFLELMKENNIVARGIDVNEQFVDYCRQKGLDVQLKDAVAELEGLEDNSLGGIFMGQVIEHLEPNYLTRLLELAAKKLEPGAYLIAETPNPTMLSTLSNSFYLDLSHIKPVHPETMKFLMEYYGFESVEIRYSESSKIPYSLALLEAGEAEIPNIRKFNEGINLLNELLFGYQDYIIIGRKSAAAGQAGGVER